MNGRISSHPLVETLMPLGNHGDSTSTVPLPGGRLDQVAHGLEFILNVPVHKRGGKWLQPWEAG